jgi:magnesium-protoporphyrin O-methyltransferase
VQYKQQLRTYFDGIGFERWSAIYGNDDNLSRIRRSIREGHNMMMAQVDAWLTARNLPVGSHILDAGCGTGLVSLALARQGYRVTSVDLAPQMVRKTREQAIQEGLDSQMRFVAGDLEVVGGSYDAVVCLDVLIHYPRLGFTAMCTRLAHRARGPLIITYAPYNRVLAMKHWVGGLFPQSQRRTTIQMIPEQIVKKTLEAAGMQICATKRVSHGFYHVAMVEAYPR